MYYTQGVIVALLLGWLARGERRSTLLLLVRLQRWGFGLRLSLSSREASRQKIEANVSHGVENKKTLSPLGCPFGAFGRWMSVSVT